MDEKEVIVIAAIAIPITLVILVIVLFSVFSRRKNKLLQEQADAKKAFDQELAESQIEIREETLRHISWELHDNIGQLMTLAKIQAQMSIEKPEMMAEVSETIGNGINELRALSKSINPEALKCIKLTDAVALEIHRFNRLKFIEAELLVEGEENAIDPSKQIILFRILQEFFSNTIKHSRASTLKVLLNYTPDNLIITAKDNGIGFVDDNDYAGIGLKNMKTRAKLINSTLELTSEKDKGTALELVYSLISNPQNSIV